MKISNFEDKVFCVITKGGWTTHDLDYHGEHPKRVEQTNSKK
jgi:hypothetical protein